MKKIAVVGLLATCLGAAPVAAQEKVVIGGSGSLTDQMEDLAKAYVTKHPGESVRVIMDSMSNTGGIEGVKAGRLTIGLVTDEPKGADKEKLVYTLVGRSPAAVAVNKAAPLTNLSEAQICDIFSGKTKSWKDVGGGEGKILVLARKKDDANTDTIREKMACFTKLQITADAVALVRGSEVLDALDKRSNTIGIINTGGGYSQRQNIKLLSIDGNAPSNEGVQSGKYKFVNERGIVTLGALKGAAKRFMDFVGSPDGQAILIRGAIIPAK